MKLRREVAAIFDKHRKLAEATDSQLAFIRMDTAILSADIQSRHIAMKMEIAELHAQIAALVARPSAAPYLIEEEPGA